MSTKEIAVVADSVTDLARLALLLGRTDRSTFHEDGQRFESDTDHTVLLSLVACSFAREYYPKLDVGLIAQFALVHDLVEAYAGDTPTLAIGDEQLQTKKEREALARQRLDSEFEERLPFVTDVLGRYEAGMEAEARFVRAMDKVVAKITNTLDGGATFAYLHISAEEARVSFARQKQDMMEYAADFEMVMCLWQEMVDRALKTF